LKINGYQQIVLILGAIFLLIILIPSEDIGHSAFPMHTLFMALGTILVMCLFLYAFKDLGEKRDKGKKK
jgi:hypothetical protein